MKKIKYELISDDKKKEIVEFYKVHSSPTTLKTFNISYLSLNKLLAEHNIPKHDEKLGTFLARMDKYGYSFFLVEDELKIIDFYKGNSFTITIQKFNIKPFYLDYLLDKYNIVKHDRKESHELTSMALYGTKWPTQSPEVKNKQHQTKKDWTVEKKLEIQEKNKKTLLDRYGCENYNNREKAKQTSIQRYGVDNVFKSDYFLERSRQTKLERYNDPKFTNRNKSKETCLKRYDSETFLGSEEGQQAIKTYNQNRYGVDYAFQSDDWQYRSLETRKEKYPNNYNNREKAKQTCIEKYGVECYCITDECRDSGNGYKSYPNEKFAKILEKNNIKYEREFKLVRYSYDFKVNNFLIEINPTITHNATISIYDRDPTKYKQYHLNKSQLAEQKGYQCIHIWDWTNIDILLDIISPNKQKIYGRKCDCKLLDKKTADMFIGENHLQGTCKGNIYNYGLYYNDKLVQVMTFGKSRYNKNYDLELLRLCSLRGYIILGGVQKLFKFALANFSEKSIISYCDRSIFSGRTYVNLGFKPLNRSISKHWYNIKTKQHILDSYLNSQGYDRIFKTNYGKGTSNRDLMLKSGFLEIYDCGQESYIFKR